MSTTKLWDLWLTFAIAAAVLSMTAACSNSDSTATATPSGPAIGPPPPQTVIFCADCPVVDVTRVIDGDTLDTSIGRLRLYGLNTPERGETCAAEATEAMERLAGSHVRVEDGSRLFDSFNRRLAYVYDINGNSLDVQLIAGGYARA